MFVYGVYIQICKKKRNSFDFTANSCLKIQTLKKVFLKKRIFKKMSIKND
tara:strand:- start:48 stop:197 length:150 start_codon:yes stop_codon:yes gene_type:complete